MFVSHTENLYQVGNISFVESYGYIDFKSLIDDECTTSIIIKEHSCLPNRVILKYFSNTTNKIHVQFFWSMFIFFYKMLLSMCMTKILQNDTQYIFSII